MADARLAALLEEVVARHGLELDEVEVIPAGRRSVVRITLDGDGPKGRGPMLDDIAAATNDISEALDASDPVPGSYTLEVSSRGVSKPLTELKHYRRNLTRLVKLNLRDGSVLEGRIVAVDDDQVTIEVTPESVKGNRNPAPVQHQFTLDQIAKAVVQIELNRSSGFDDEDGLADDEDGLADDDGDEIDELDDEEDDLDEDEAVAETDPADAEPAR